jgi:hypothetical protein
MIPFFGLLLAIAYVYWLLGSGIHTDPEATYGEAFSTAVCWMGRGGLVVLAVSAVLQEVA